MPREFSPEERERIRDSLLKEGREQFIRFGIRKARVEEIAEAVGISKGSFYNFFRSKEELYIVIRDQEEMELKNAFIQRLFPNGVATRNAIRDFLRGVLEFMGKSPFLSIMIRPGEMEYILRKMPPEWLDQHWKEDRKFLTELVESWQQQGVVRNDLSAERIVGVISTLVTIPLHKDQLDFINYDDALALLTSMLADNLVTPEVRYD